jgi:RNA polymerase sigma factor (sigma-70 family)
MAYLLSPDEFAAARKAVDAGDVTPELFAFIHRLVGVHVASRLLPATLSPLGVWSAEAVDDLVQQWFADQLVPGALRRAFDRSDEAAGLARYLDRALRNWLIDRARARAEPRLLMRARKILSEEDRFARFIDAAHWQDAWWGLREWSDPSPYQGSDADLVAVSFRAGDLTYVRVGGAGADPVLSRADLRTLLATLFLETTALLTLRHVDRVLRTRFSTAYVQVTAGLVDEVREDADLGRLEIDVVVRSITSQLNGRQLALLGRRYREQRTFAELAREFGCAHGTVENELKRAFAIIHEEIADDEHYQAVLEKLLDVSVL